MTRHVKAKREKIQHKQYRGLIAQFAIFLVLRLIDLTASIAVLENAWEDSAHWASLNETLLNTTTGLHRSSYAQNIKPRSIKYRFITHWSTDLESGEPPSTNSRNINSRSIKLPSIKPRDINPRKINFQSINPRGIKPRRTNPRSIVHTSGKLNPYIIELLRNGSRDVDSRNIVPLEFNLEKTDFLRIDAGNDDHRNADTRKSNQRNVDLRSIMSRKRGKKIILNIKRRQIDPSGYPDTILTDQCYNTDSRWVKKEAYSKISHYKVVLGLTVFFNIVSITAFLTHLCFWIATLKLTFEVGIDNQTRVTRLTRNSLLSLASAVFRDVPLSCLNVELLALRSGRDGLACVACIFAGKCPPAEHVIDSLNLAKSLLYFDYFIMLTNSIWKGVSGFYRLSRFKEVRLYYIRACAAIVFGFLYCITTFTPAMYLFIYRYFAIPGLGSTAPFLQEIAKRVIVIGTTIWVVCGSAVICCPILYTIRLNTN